MLLRGNNLYKRKELTMMKVANELQNNYEINSISFNSNRENLRFQRYSNQNRFRGKINGKENIASLFTSSENYRDKQGKSKQTNQNISNRLPLSALNNQMYINIPFKQQTLKQNKIIKAKEKIELYDELFNQTIKIKQFKEDNIPFTHCRFLPKVQWMKIDNDIKTDDEQLSDATKMLHNWLGETIKYMKENDCYMSKNIQRNFILLRKANNLNKK